MRSIFCSASILLCVALALFSPPAYGHTPAKPAVYESTSYTCPSGTYSFKIEKIAPKPLIVTWDTNTTRVQMGNKAIAPAAKARPSLPLMVACRGAFRPAFS